MNMEYPGPDGPKRSAKVMEQQALRQIFGQFASGVTVISSGGSDETHGMTANAFMSVSMDPALILISLQNTCRMRGIVEARGRFGVSILADKQAAVSDHFAGRGENPEAAKFEWRGGDTPVIAGALAWIACSVEQQHQAGDHTLFIARVDDFSHVDGAPLLFFSGQYRTLIEWAKA